MKYNALICLLFVLGCSSSIPQYDEQPKTWTIKEAEQPKDKPDEKKPDRTDLFFGPDELLPVDFKQDNTILTLPNARAQLNVVFTTTRDRFWDEQADRKIWDTRGKTYLEMSFPKSTDKRMRKFELVKTVSNKLFTRWTGVWGPLTLLQYSRRSLTVFWGEPTDSNHEEDFKAAYSVVQVKLYNTHTGTIIDHRFPVAWTREATQLVSFCQDLGTEPKNPKCLTKFIVK